jgi:hypothetical protein
MSKRNSTKEEDPEQGSSKIGGKKTESIPMGHRSVIIKPIKYKSKKALPLFFLAERNSSFSILRFLPKRIRPSYTKKGFALG